MNKKLFIVLCLALTNNVYCSVPQKKSELEQHAQASKKIRLEGLNTELIEKLLPPLAAIVIRLLGNQEDISEALIQNDYEGIIQCINEPGFEANGVCLNGKTPLYIAVTIELEYQGRRLVECIIPLLRKKGANPNLKCDDQKSPSDLIHESLKKIPARLLKDRPSDMARRHKTPDAFLRERCKKLLAAVSTQQSATSCVIS